MRPLLLLTFTILPLLARTCNHRDGGKGFGRGIQTFLGNFYLDENDFLGGIWQGFTRHTWEMPQSLIGHAYTHARNSFGTVDQIEYWGGSTFAIDEDVTDFNGWLGVSLGNFINIKLPGKLDRHHAGGWIYSGDGLFLHEYGHTKDSKLFGLLYLFAIGIPSASGKEWTEIRANKHAWGYTKKHKLLNTWPYTDYPTE